MNLIEDLARLAQGFNLNTPDRVKAAQLRVDMLSAETGYEPNSYLPISPELDLAQRDLTLAVHDLLQEQRIHSHGYVTLTSENLTGPITVSVADARFGESFFGAVGHTQVDFHPLLSVEVQQPSFDPVIDIQGIQPVVQPIIIK
jgi:hypothetical protein